MVVFVSGGFAPMLEELGPMHPTLLRGYRTMVELPQVPANLSLVAACLVVVLVMEQERKRQPGRPLARLLRGSAAVAAAAGMLLTGLHGISSIPDILSYRHPVASAATMPGCGCCGS